MKPNLAAIATALGPLGIDTYETGNEMTHDSKGIGFLTGKHHLGSIQVDHSYAGNRPQDFNNTNWPILRGALRGMIDGVKSVQPKARCGVNFLYSHIGAADMLWDGNRPTL